MAPVRPVVLIVDPAEGPLSQGGFLRAHSFDVMWARDGESAHHVLDERRVDCLVTELRAPRIDGFLLLRHGLAQNPDLCAVVIAGPDQLPMALEAMREGAYDFQFRPVHFEKLLAVLDRGIRHQRLAARVVEMEDRLDERLGVEHLTGVSPSMDRVRDQIRQMSGSRGTVLIEGESGTGRRLAARTIHHNSPGRDQPFVWMDFATLAAHQVEAELMGEESPDGSCRKGRIELAGAGTLLLHEVGLAPLPIQVKLLRLVQDREYERRSGQTTLKAQARLMATSSRDLEAEVAAGRFRGDLYRRLSAVRLTMPSLRDRPEDIPLLVEAFIREAGQGRGRKVPGITSGLLDRLMRHDWPGNIRELRGVVEGMMAVVDRKRLLDLSDLPPSLKLEEPLREVLHVTVGMTVEEAERMLIAATLRHTGGDKTRAAALLGIGLRTLYRRIQALRLA